MAPSRTDAPENILPPRDRYRAAAQPVRVYGWGEVIVRAAGAYLAAAWFVIAAVAMFGLRIPVLGLWFGAWAVWIVARHHVKARRRG